MIDNMTNIDFNLLLAERIPAARNLIRTHVTVEYPVEITVGDIFIEAMGTYDDTGTLEVVTINGREYTTDQVVGAYSTLGTITAGWDKDLDGGILEDLVAEAYRDIADAAGDMKYEEWRDR